LKIDVDALKHVGALTLYKIYLTYICCAFVGLDNKQKRTLYYKLLSAENIHVPVVQYPTLSLCHNLTHLW